MNTTKTVLITGSSSGIGFGLALKYARNGYNTYASLRDISSEGAKNLQKISQTEKLPLHIIAVDVTDEKSIDSALNSIDGTIDILINNAGFGYVGPIEDFSIDEIKKQYDTNVFGIIRMIKAVAPKMREQKEGMIINISSINGLVPFPLWGIYSSSKYAVETLSESMAFELSHFGIKVVIVEPGSFLTSFTKNRKFAEKATTENSAYKKLTTSFFERFAKAHKKAESGLAGKLTNSDRVVNKIYKISQTANPALRYRVGIDSHIFYFSYKILPQKIWDFLLHTAYKW